MFLLIVDNSVHELFANVSIALKLYLCRFISPTAKESVRFQYLKGNSELLEKLNEQKRLASLVFRSIECQLLRNNNFSSIICNFCRRQSKT